MIDQSRFDNLADQIVSDGRLVSYSSLRQLYREEDGTGVSDRDLQKPYANWRSRRHYKGHLAVLDLPEEMEKAIASFAATAMKIAEARAQASLPILGAQSTTAGFLEQMQRIVTGLERQLIAIADENRALKDQIAVLQQPSAIPVVVEAPRLETPIVATRQRKSGAPALAAKVFWDQVISDLSNRIYSIGRSMNADDLLLEVPLETKNFAALAFQELDKKALVHKLHQRIEGKKYGLFVREDSTFSVVPLSPNVPLAMPAVAAA